MRSQKLARITEFTKDDGNPLRAGAESRYSTKRVERFGNKVFSVPILWILASVLEVGDSGIFRAIHLAREKLKLALLTSGRRDGKV